MGPGRTASVVLAGMPVPIIFRSSIMATSRISMRLFIVGATGGVGRLMVDQALGRGHHVTAFVRSPQKMEPPREGLTVIAGDPRDEDALRAALPGHQAVLSALGPPGPRRTTIVGDGARSLVPAMLASGVQRLLIVGVAVLFDDIGPLATVMRRTLLRNVARDSAEMERIVVSSPLDWTIARPPRLISGPLTGGYRVADDDLPGGAGVNAKVSRADLAHFLLEELERPAHVRRIVGVAYTKAPRTAGARLRAPA
jgi:putative NADH-flavin reductase